MITGQNQILPFLFTAASAINTRNTNSFNNDNRAKSDSTLFIHWQFHPSEIGKTTTCNIYNKTLRSHDKFNEMEIALSQPRNLRDILCHTKLQDIPHQHVSELLQSLGITTD
jgi:hypothetical protein